MTSVISDADLEQLLKDVQHGSMLDIKKLWAALMELKDRRFMQKREEERHDTY